MKFIDLFSGIGGFRLGMEMAGHECLGHCEIDKYADKSYRAMHEVKEGEWFESDISNVDINRIPKCDCWCFGFPCQDISVAGKQRGFGGTRSSLFFAVTKIIRNLKEEDRPGYLFIENVKNFFSVNDGWDFLSALIELDEIGYDAEWQLLNSKDYGVPQNRERVFIVGHLRGRNTRKVFPISGSNGKTPKQIINGKQANRVMSVDGSSVCLVGNGGVQGAKTGLYLINKDRDSIKFRNNFNAVGANEYKGLDNHGARTGVLKVERTPLRFLDRNGKKTDGDYAFCVDSSNTGGIKEYHENDIIRIRRLSPKECFRLQGFPDEYFERAARVNSDTQLYKQAGNSVTVNVIHEIARRMNFD